jgi:rod shape-determining protein MreD
VGPFITLLWLALLAVLQTSAMPFAALGPAKPFLPLLAVVAWGLVKSPVSATWWAVGLGALLDMATPSPPGMYTVPMIAAAAVVTLGRSRLFPTNFLLPGAVAALATVAFTLVQRALLSATLADAAGVSWSVAALADDLAPALVLNLLWLPALYFPLRFIADRTGPPKMEWGR